MERGMDQKNALDIYLELAEREHFMQPNKIVVCYAKFRRQESYSMVDARCGGDKECDSYFSSVVMCKVNVNLHSARNIHICIVKEVEAYGYKDFDIYCWGERNLFVVMWRKENKLLLRVYAKSKLACTQRETYQLMDGERGSG